MDFYEFFDFGHAGQQFRAFVHHDSDKGAPWGEECGHGPVSEWRHKDTKRAGEYIIAQDRNQCRFYDLREAQKIALRDIWGAPSEWIDAFVTKHGREPTRREIAAEAVRMDCERLRAWCADEWHWCGVSVKLLVSDGEPVGDDYAHALWGIESDAGDYLREVAEELAAEALKDGLEEAARLRAKAKAIEAACKGA